MIRRLSDPAVPISGASTLITPTIWLVAGTAAGLVSLISTVALVCAVKYLEYRQTVRRDQHVREVAGLAVREHLALSATSSSHGLSIRVAPHSKDDLDA